MIQAVAANQNPMLDTIYALATPFGKSGVAILRISGPMALRLLFDLGYEAIPTPRQATYFKFMDKKAAETVDQALFIFFPGPGSFTGEDVLELHLHGSIAVINHFMRIFGSLSYLRPAEPGEFSKRAFLNDKLDLTMAEGLVDLINAETEVQKKVALRQYGGELERLYDGWREQILGCMARMEAFIDFPEEDIPEAEVLQAVALVQDIAHEIRRHLQQSPRAELIADGVHIAIFGPPNAGKSSLLNWLSQKEVAIVSDIPGTTRDVLQVRTDLEGLLAIFYDTAGLREATDDTIERQGMVKALEVVAAADFKVLVLDSTDVTQAADFVSTHKEVIDEHTICLLNKIDLLDVDSMYHTVDIGIGEGSILEVSLTTEIGLLAFMDKLKATISHSHYHADIPLITKARYRKALAECCDALEVISPIWALDLIAEHMREAAWAIGSITGKIDVEEVLDVIFSTFCIGK